jgi:hypothetical protein
MKFVAALLMACESQDADQFAKTVQEFQRITPLDKVNTKLVVKAKMRYCPEKETAISNVAKEMNLVDGDSDDNTPADKQKDEGYDLC